MDQEKLVFTLLKHRDEVQLIIRSDKTDDRVYSWLLFKQDSDLDVDKVLEMTDQVLEQIVETYFNNNQSVRDALLNYDDLISTVKKEIEGFFEI
ncbi:MAG: hypothetical protein ACW98Y_16760 [Candidatus Thorarchaeota archaeon]|jgi:hypothetical protein